MTTSLRHQLQERIPAEIKLQENLGPVFIVVVTRTTSCQNLRSPTDLKKEFGRINDYLHSSFEFQLFSQMVPSHRNGSLVIDIQAYEPYLW